jgi:hypothetical protein
MRILNVQTSARRLLETGTDPLMGVRAVLKMHNPRFSIESRTPVLEITTGLQTIVEFMFSNNRP